MKILRPNHDTLLLSSFFLMLSVACWPTPNPSSLPNPAAPETSEAVQTEHPVEIAKLPEATHDHNKPARPAIPRYLPESVISVPDKEAASRRLEYNTLLRSRSIDTPANGGWHYRLTTAGAIVGFEFSNHGGNRILPPLRNVAKQQMYTRDFQFRFDGRARQDIHLTVTDWAPSADRVFRLSELMNSSLYFFPRSFLPAIVNLADTNLVTLPTGEEVTFNAMTQEIVSGVLSESALDLTPDRNARKFPAISYNGKGVLVRANSRGADPRIGTTATITTGSINSNCEKGINCKQCQIPARDLWDQSGAVRFKYPSDQEFDRFLLSRCEFGLPKNDNGYVLTMPN